MRMNFRGVAVALLLAVIGAWASPPVALAQGAGAQGGRVPEDAFWQVPANASFPMVRQISLGLGKSFLLQFPFELKDVVVSSPDKVDAVVQSSNRVFLIAKSEGQTNAFFFDTRGQQILRLDVNVGADSEALDSILKRFVPGSNIRAEMAGKAAILSGTVRTPLDGKRAVDIACQFVYANKVVGQVAASGGNNSTNFNVTSQNPPSQASMRAARRRRPPLAAATPSSSSTCSPSTARSR